MLTTTSHFPGVIIQDSQKVGDWLQAMSCGQGMDPENDQVRGFAGEVTGWRVAAGLGESGLTDEDLEGGGHSQDYSSHGRRFRAGELLGHPNDRSQGVADAAMAFVDTSMAAYAPWYDRMRGFDELARVDEASFGEKLTLQPAPGTPLGGTTLAVLAIHCGGEAVAFPVLYIANDSRMRQSYLVELGVKNHGLLQPLETITTDVKPIQADHIPVQLLEDEIAKILKGSGFSDEAHFKAKSEGSPDLAFEQSQKGYRLWTRARVANTNTTFSVRITAPKAVPVRQSDGTVRYEFTRPTLSAEWHTSAALVDPVQIADWTRRMQAIDDLLTRIESLPSRY